MIIKWLRARKACKQMERQIDAARAEAQKAKREQEMDEYCDELKDAFIKSGIHPFNRANRHRDGDFVTMYGILNGRIVKGTITKRGAFLIEYIEMP